MWGKSSMENIRGNGIQAAALGYTREKEEGPRERGQHGRESRHRVL